MTFAEVLPSLAAGKYARVRGFSQPYRLHAGRLECRPLEAWNKSNLDLDSALGEDWELAEEVAKPSAPSYFEDWLKAQVEISELRATIARLERELAEAKQAKQSPACDACAEVCQGLRGDLAQANASAELAIRLLGMRP